MDRWPLVGRIEEKAHLARVIDDPERAGVVVAGRAGVGKTRLLQEAVGAATNCHVELVTATESARSLPFGAFAHLLPEDLGTTDRVDLLAVIGRHFIGRMLGKPAVLAVDDMHLLDGFSAALVHHMATARLATLLLTLRSGELAPDAVTALHRDGVVSRLELQPISRAEFNQVVDKALDGPVESLTLDRMWAVTEGNVLFARELIDDALDAGTLGRHHGVWRWAGGLGVAPRLRETVAARLGGLGSSERAFLEVLCVGEPISLSSAGRLAPDASLPDLERSGLLVVERTDHGTLVRLAHPLFSETLRATMPAALHRQINHDLAEDLAGAGSQNPSDALRLALLREAAGEPSDPGLLAEGARNANSLSDHALAERLARASVLAGGQFNAHLELGRALGGQNRFEEAEVVLTPLVDSNELSDNVREQLADAISQTIGYGLGRVDDTLAVLEAIEDATGDPVTKALIQCHRATLLGFGVRFGEAAELGMLALQAVDDDAVRIRSLTSVGLALVMAGRIDDALALGDGALEPALHLQDRLPRAPSWVVMSRCLALTFAGRVEESLGLLDLAMGAVSHPSPETLGQANAYRGRFHLFQGRAQSASRLLTDAAVTARDSPSIEPSWCLALAAEAHALLGRHGEASEAAAEAVSLDRAEMWVYRPDELRALAWVDAQDGRISSAIDQLLHAADLAVSGGQRSLELIILADALRLGEDRAAERALALAEHVDGELSAAIAAHARAILSTAAVDLETAATAFGGIGSSLVAAELWASASAARQREGLPARAAEAGRHSAALAERCEGARTQPLGWAVARLTLSRT